MAIDSVTAYQYGGIYQSDIRRELERGKVAPEVEEARVQRILEEQRKRVQPVYETKGKLVDIII